MPPNIIATGRDPERGAEQFFQKEPGHEQVARLLEHAHRTRAKKLLCAVNLGEIIYITERACRKSRQYQPDPVKPQLQIVKR